MPPKNPSLTRRRLVAGLTVGTVAGTVAASGRSTAGTKAPHDAVAWQDRPRDGHRCADCRHWTPAERAGRFVAEPASPDAWCMLFRSRAD